MQTQMYPYSRFALLILVVLERKNFPLFMTPHCGIVHVNMIYNYIPDPIPYIKSPTPYFC